MHRKLLTIIIPTYNRCKYVEENLKVTVPLVERNKEEVHLYISDNASTDDTKKIVEYYLKKYPDIITYHCQSHNLTASPNFNHAVHCVETEYVYIIGDDDILLPNSIETMLYYIKQFPQVSMFHFNYLMGDSEMKNFKLKYEKSFSGIYPQLFERGGDFIKSFFHGPSFVSSNLFKVEAWAKGDDVDMSLYPGYGWFMHLYKGILNETCLFSFIPIVAMRTGYAYVKNWPLYSIYGLSKLFKDLSQDYPGIYESWNKYRTDQKYDLLMDIASTCNDRKRYKKDKKLLNQYLPNRFFKFMLYLNLYILPTIIIKGFEFYLFIALKKLRVVIDKFKSNRKQN